MISIRKISKVETGIEKVVFSSRWGHHVYNDRRKLFDQLLQFIAPCQIKCVLCDREFLSGEWIAYLKGHQISYTIRAKGGSRAIRDNV